MTSPSIDARPGPTEQDLPAWAAKAPGWLQPYLRPEMLAMILLGFASGLPLYLVYQKTSFWMREEGVDLSTIGFFYWVGLFYSFKFIWAPIIDKAKVPWLHDKVGHRRSWMMTSMAGTMFALFVVAASDPSEGILIILCGALGLAFCGATLDVSIDAWRIESAPSERQANMAASYSLGYRGALIFSNLGLVIADFANWHVSFVVMGLAMGLTALLVLVVKEPTERRQHQDVHGMPFFAGPWNAIAVAVGLFILARVFRWLPFGDSIVDPLAIIAVLILLLGALVFKGTKTSLPLRLAIAGIGMVYVCAREIAGLVMTPPEGGSPVFSLIVVTISILAVGGLIRLVLLAVLGGRPTGDEEKAPLTRGKLYVMFATPFLQVWERYGKAMIPIFGFVMIYRLSDFTMGVMAVPLYADLGYDKAVVGGLQGGPGVIATIIGLFIGGAFANMIGVKKSLIIGALLTFVTNGFYAYFAANATGTDPEFLALAICADNVAGGFVTTVFIAYLSSLVDPDYAATQYALYSSVYAIVNKFVAGFSGAMAEAMGYVGFFLVTASYAIPAALLVFVLMAIDRRNQREDQLPTAAA